MLLVDTSAWIELFRSPGPQPGGFPDLEEVVTCLPVIQEVLQGFRDESAFRLARDAMLALPIVESPLLQDVVLEAAELYRHARRAGLTVRSSVDCLIATCATRHALPVLHHDRDFGALAKVSSLQTQELLLS